MFFDRHLSSRGRREAGYLHRVVLDKPDRAGIVHSNAVRMAIGGWHGGFRECICRGIEKSNLVPCILGEPEITVFVKEQIIWVGAGGRHFPLRPLGRAPWDQSTNGVGRRFCEPDITIFGGQKDRAGISARLKVIFHQ